MPSETQKPIREITLIRPQMHVVCSEGGRVGVVDRVEGDRIKLTKEDSADGRQHDIPASLVAALEDERVRLTITCDEVMRRWQRA